MLPAAHRLRRSADFASAVRGGRRSSRGSVVVHLTLAAPSGDTRPAPVGEEPAKAGFVVSKAVGGAVVRNKVKRRLRHLMAERITGIPTGARIVVRALPGAATAGYPQLGLDLDAALEHVMRQRTKK
jgi:ribonuclease P protein component